MDVMDKLTILTDAAKYDAACTSSGAQRGHRKGCIGNTSSSVAGCCHTFSGDGRCVTLLKVLMTNCCVFDCKYCVNRCSNDTRRAIFSPEELAELTIQFYRRNYIEGLFLSSGVLVSPDYTTERMIRCLDLLRNRHRFNGYIHAKAIPGTSPELVTRLGLLADRLSVNVELPSERGLNTLAPNKSRKAIFRPMGLITNTLRENKEELVKYRHTPRFAPAGQSTQMIIGATGESDYEIMAVTEALYQKFDLKRVFYSAFINVNQDASLPAVDGQPPLRREHRLYQADFLLRYYGFRADELLTEKRPFFNTYLDPKCDWALSHLEHFPVEINTADFDTLLRVPGIGTKSASRIVKARQTGSLDYQALKAIGVVMKRAIYFITCNGRMMYQFLKIDEDYITRNLLENDKDVMKGFGEKVTYKQLTLFDDCGIEG